MKKISKKLRALETAKKIVAQENKKEGVLRLLNELQEDILAIQEQQESEEHSRRELLRAMAVGGFDDNGPARRW